MGMYDDNPLYGNNQSTPTDLSGSVNNQPNYLLEGGTDGVEYTETFDEPKDNSARNGAYAAAGAAAGSTLQQATSDNTNPALQHQGNISTVGDTWDYDRSDVIVDDNDFNRNVYYQNYSNDDNPYDYNAGQGAKVVGNSMGKGASEGFKYGGLFGGLFGALGGATSGFGKNIVSKRKAKEYEAIADANRTAYYDKQRTFLDNRNQEIRNAAQQQQLGQRGIPSYDTNAYNIG